MASTVTRPFALPVEKESARITRPTGKGVEIAPSLFVLPSVLLLVFWAYYPLLDTVRISFFDGTLLSRPQAFVRFKNYVTVASTPEFQMSLANTFKYIAGMIPLAVILPLAVAL